LKVCLQIWRAGLELSLLIFLLPLATMVAEVGGWIWRGKLGVRFVKLFLKLAFGVHPSRPWSLR
jgi:hypothetical protein